MMQFGSIGNGANGGVSRLQGQEMKALECIGESKNALPLATLLGHAAVP